MSLKSVLKEIPGAKSSVQKLRWSTRIAKRKTLELRADNPEKICIVLAGYKRFTWNIFFDRLTHMIPADVHVCIASSGKYDQELSDMAHQNGWSYIATKKNNVSLLQNTVIASFPTAKYIYKVDEDIFVTSGLFESMFAKMTQLQSSNSEVIPGLVAPLIPVNGFGYRRLLLKTGLLNAYERLFGIAKMAAGDDQPIENNPDVAKFFWGGNDSPFPSIDILANQLGSSESQFETCPIHFSIGCILFTRNIWQQMGGFPVGVGNAMGLDEISLNTYCVLFSRPMIIDDNAIAGHLSFGTQNQVMKDFYLGHPENFSLAEEASVESARK